jgi:CRISPR-associated protein Cas1
MELILNTYGVSLNRDNEGFVITTEEGRQRIPAVGIDSIQISRGAQITSDAVMLAVEREIEVVFMDKAGNPIGRVWSPKYGSISTIRKGQLNFSFTNDAVDWIKDVICRKIENQQALMMMLKTDDSEATSLVEKSIRRLEDYRTKITKLDGEIVNDIASTLRGWEGQASKIYFSTLNNFIPEAYRFENRSQHPATDVTNAFLNYGYGLLYGKIEGAMIKVGIDPYIGILHRDDYNRPVLVFDVIELFRVWVDYVVYTLIAQNIVTDEYYSVHEDGSYWLEGLGRRVLIQSLNDYMDEQITQQGMTRSRENQLFLYVQNLAQTFKKYEI